VPEANGALHVVPQLIPAGELVTVPVPLPAGTTVSTGSCEVLNVAVTEAFAFSVSTQLPAPLHAPPHPEKVEPAVGVAVNVTFVPSAKEALHVVPQLIPDGELVTVPEPVPAKVTVSVGFPPVVLKVAVTDVFTLIVTLQVVVPLHAPPHPAKVEPPVGVAVSVTSVPSSNVPTHCEPQLMPAGELVTVPVPLPARLTVNEGFELAVNVAVTDVLADKVTLQVDVPLHAPLQPAKDDPSDAVGVSVTDVPASKVALQVFPQLIPPGLLLTVPCPVPAVCTLSCTPPGGLGLLSVDPPQPAR
jgi:hypothetical protein